MEENKKNAPEKVTKGEVGKWFKVGGILCAIAGASALLLTLLNLVTAPIIAQNNANKQLGGYKVIFDTMAAISDPTKLEDDAELSEYVIAYSDTAKTQEIGYIYTSESIAVKSYGNIKAMVGISGETDSPTLGKVYLVENTLSYSSTFVKGYVDPFNANPSDTTLENVKCGATFGAETLRDVIKAARDHYSSMGDSFKEDLANDVKMIWGEGNGYDATLSKTDNVAGATYVKKSYSFYEDDTMTGQIGRLYSAKYKGDNGDIYLTVSIKGTAEAPIYDKLVITKNTLVDTTSIDAYVNAYNTNPSEETLNAASSAEEKAIKAMVSEAKDTFVKDGGLDSCESKFAGMVTSAKAYGDPVVLEKDDPKVNVLRYWSLFSDEEKTTEIAKVYKVNAKMNAKAEIGPIESDTTFLLSISGDKETPVLGKIVCLANSSGAWTPSIIESWMSNFDSSKTEADTEGTTATYSLKAIWEGISKAKDLYSGKEAA